VRRARRLREISLLVFLSLFLPLEALAQSPASMNRIDLHDGWTVQTSRKVRATGDAISTPKFQTKGWYRTSVPMTVVGVQVAAGEFPQPYYGMNLRKMPGIEGYEIGEGFAHKPIPNDSPYAASWWYLLPPIFLQSYARAREGSPGMLKRDGSILSANVGGAH
jgi:exo-1,4-beta-D-glucosaminidase